MKITIVSCLALIVCLTAGCMQPVEREVLRLWDDGVPTGLDTGPKDIPTLTAYPADGTNRTDCAVIVCPGGGYGHLAFAKEGTEIAEWFNSIGVSAFVLTYRLPADGYRHPVPLMDAQQAIRLVRFRADEWNVDPAKVGIIGFSAGGHLASSAGTHFDQPVPTADSNELDDVSCRPDFQVLIYPVISMQDGITHQGSKKYLLGDRPDSALVDRMSNDEQVTSQTPPAFLVHASDDKAVGVENSLRFYEACRAQNVPVEMHVYLKGGHGFGMRPAAGPAAQWPELCCQWLEQVGFLPK